MFKPRVDICKSKEMELRLEKLKNPVMKKFFSTEDQWKPRKYQKNPLIPEAKPSKKFEKINYLG